MAEKEKVKVKGGRTNHAGSLIIGSDKKNQSMRRTRRKQHRPEGTFKSSSSGTNKEG